MCLSKRIFTLSCTALIASSFSAFLFGEKAYAISIIDDVKVISPLRENEPVIEKSSQKVEKKTIELEKETEKIEKLQEKKAKLSEAVEHLRKDLEVIEKKIADKRARVAAEKARIERLKSMFVNVNRYASNSAGNMYAPGNCTWYVKDRRPDLPNDLGNANTWYSRAQSMGWNVGSTPKKGAVATSTAGYWGHVAYVEGVSLDGQYVTISEMNWGGLYNMNTRTVHYTEFLYIYELN